MKDGFRQEVGPEARAPELHLVDTVLIDCLNGARGPDAFNWAAPEDMQSALAAAKFLDAPLRRREAPMPSYQGIAEGLANRGSLTDIALAAAKLGNPKAEIGNPNLTGGERAMRFARGSAAAGTWLAGAAFTAVHAASPRVARLAEPPLGLAAAAGRAAQSTAERPAFDLFSAARRFVWEEYGVECNNPDRAGLLQLFLLASLTSGLSRLGPSVPDETLIASATRLTNAYAPLQMSGLEKVPVKKDGEDAKVDTPGAAVIPFALGINRTLYSDLDAPPAELRSARASRIRVLSGVFDDNTAKGWEDYTKALSRSNDKPKSRRPSGQAREELREHTRSYESALKEPYVSFALDAEDAISKIKSGQGGGYDSLVSLMSAAQERMRLQSDPEREMFSTFWSSTMRLYRQEVAGHVDSQTDAIHRGVAPVGTLHFADSMVRSPETWSRILDVRQLQRLESALNRAAVDWYSQPRNGQHPVSMDVMRRAYIHTLSGAPSSDELARQRAQHLIEPLPRNPNTRRPIEHGLPREVVKLIEEERKIAGRQLANKLFDLVAR